MPGLTRGDPIRFDASQNGVLDGVRVIDMSRLVAGNMISHMLADFGADVVKIEGRDGDTLRDFRESGHSFWWKTYGRNKRSLGLDLKREEGRQVLLRLLRDADVLVESYRPGTLEKMGLGPELLHEINPNLLIVRISGFGQTGPYSLRPGFGALIEGMAGFADRNGFSDRVPALAPMALGDMTAGIFGAFGIVCALWAQGRGQVRGQVVDLSLLEPLVPVLGPDVMIHRVTGDMRKRMGSRAHMFCPGNVYRCTDGGHIAVSGPTEPTARLIFRGLGLEAMLEDVRFATNAVRLANREEVEQAFTAWFSVRTRAEALAQLRRCGAPASTVYSVPELVKDPHVREREIFVEVEDADFGTLPMHNMTPRFSKTPGTWRRPAPKLGEHSVEILAEAAYTQADIARLKDEGVIF